VPSKPEDHRRCPWGTDRALLALSLGFSKFFPPVIDSPSSIRSRNCWLCATQSSRNGLTELSRRCMSLQIPSGATSQLRVHSVRKKMYVRHTYIRHSGCINSPTTTSTMSCVTTTRLPVAPALYQLRCASRLLISWSHRLYFNHVVRHDYLYPGRTGFTSTMLCAVTTRLPIAPALHQLRRVSRLLVS
jgi:hypothetical protein